MNTGANQSHSSLEEHEPLGNVQYEEYTDPSAFESPTESITGNDDEADDDSDLSPPSSGKPLVKQTSFSKF